MIPTNKVVGMSRTNQVHGNIAVIAGRKARERERRLKEAEALAQEETNYVDPNED